MALKGRIDPGEKRFKPIDNMTNNGGKDYGMKISELSDYFLQGYLDRLSERTSESLWAVQAEAVKKGILDSDWKSFLVSAPHGSGKTLVAELAIVKKLQEKPVAQILYLVPYKAMAREIYQKFDFLRDKPFGKRVGMWTGDKALDEEPLLGTNLLVLTYELFQLMLRSDIDTVLGVDLIVIDELHFIEEPNRGPRQEAAITWLLSLPRRPPILALSSIVKNIKQIREWLDCGKNYVTSKKRKNPLYEGIVNPVSMSIEFYDNGRKVREEPLSVQEIQGKLSLLISCVVDYLQKAERGKRQQVMVFVPTRASARQTAQALSTKLREYVSSGDIDLPEKDISNALDRLKETTHSSSDTLSTFGKLLATGVAFHHAGLGGRLRRLIETLFREQHLVVLVATTTLGIGVNLPASRVYFLETTAARNPLSPIKYRNMAGRAGRPDFWETGESIILSEYENDTESAKAEYILTPEPLLESYILRNPPETEEALLAWISQGLESFNKLLQIVMGSFRPPKSDSEARDIILDSLHALEKYQFIELDVSGSEPRFRCTTLGHVSATSGARPDDSRFLISNLSPDSLIDEDGEFDRLAALFYLCLTSRFDNVYIGKEVRDPPTYHNYLSTLDRSARSNLFSSGDRTKHAFFTACLLDDWISGKSLREISKSIKREYSAEELVERLVPNAVEMLHYYLQIADKCGPDLVGSNRDLLDHLHTLRDCLEVGVDTDKIDLARLFIRRDDGRHIVERLSSLGIKTVQDLLEFPYEDFNEELAGMERSKFFFSKSRALLLIKGIHERKDEYIRLLAKHLFVYSDVIEKLLSKPEKFEEGVRSAAEQIASNWPNSLKARQVRDRGAGSNLPRPEVYIISSKGEEPVRLCFEAKSQQRRIPISSHEKALSPTSKCRGSSTHRITVGWPSFDENLHSTAQDREVTLIDAQAFALVYVWTISKMLTLNKLLSGFDKTGIIQPDVFDSRIPGWWKPRTALF